MDFVEFLGKCVSPFHTCIQIKHLLTQAGFVELNEVDAWDIARGGKYFFIRGCSAIAFAIGGKYQVGQPFKIIAAHTDFPALRIKPHSTVTRHGCLSVGVQPYGGGLWNTWFDRDLAVAGQAIVCQGGKTQVLPVKLHRTEREQVSRAHANRCRRDAMNAVLCHFDREAYKNFNLQQHLLPMLVSTLRAQPHPQQGGACALHHPALMTAIAEELHVPVEAIADVDLCLYDCQGPVVGGVAGEYVFGQHLDNTLMTYCAVRSFVDSMGSLTEDGGVRLCCCFDHEEVGSRSAEGAGSIALSSLITRLLAALSEGRPPEGAFDRTVRTSMVVSADVAHAVHPNYCEKHDESHQMEMAAGPVLKFDYCLRYSTGLVTAFILAELARRMNVPIQRYVVRNDQPCGTTIGPILAAGCQIPVADLGIAMLSMHSIREQCHVDDIGYTVRLFKAFFENFADVAGAIEVKTSAS